MVAGSSSTGSGGDGAAETKPKEIVLFGVRVVVDNMRKIVSLNNMNEYEHLNDNEEDEDAAAGASAAVSGYKSADDTVHHSSSASERRSQRKRGLPWTEEEHKKFLVGLQKMGKGDWRGISRNFVKTRTPTQVASHAQKHFNRNSSLNRRRRRSSLFDITTDMVTEAPMEEQQAPCQDSKSSNQAPRSNPPLQANRTTSFPVRTASPAVLPLQIESPAMENRSLGQGKQSLNYSTNLVLTAPCTSALPDLNLNLKPIADSYPLSSSDQGGSSSRHSTLQTMASLKNGDNIIIVA
ncbi:TRANSCRIPTIONAL ADAPTOR 2 ADA2 -RELATED [Salix purpurea]|uniref:TRANSCRIPTIONAL ADAPTOR 2 ADA2 -RELATED n=1 Tax=Salix purpurea TaxID=77065 RepID=A0A9Q0ZWG7_SALPP|nr:TRANSCRIPTIONAL ADAPTOR 2 ADA2 -RELATED [Salix purpurea]